MNFILSSDLPWGTSSVAVLGADLTVVFLVDALGPGDHQRVGVAAAVGRLLVPREGGVAGLGPARGDVPDADAVAPFVDVLAVDLVGDVRNAVEEAVLVEGAVQAALAAGAVIGGENDQRVVELADPLEVVQDAAELVVGVGELAREGLHLAGVKGLFLVVQGVPGRDLGVARGELGSLGHDAHLDLTGQDHLAGLVVAHVELAPELLDPFTRRLVRRVHRAGGPEHAKRLVLRRGPLHGDPADRGVGHILVHVVSGRS